jgi:Rrf2 family protein
MRVSAKAEYACLAALALARHGFESAPLRIREISEEYEIPERYLVQILLQLKGAGIVSSTRGASGGYRLARDPSMISIGDVLSAVEPPETSRRVADSHEHSTSWVLTSLWDDVRAAERAVLYGKSLAELAQECSAHEWVI